MLVGSFLAVGLAAPRLLWPALAVAAGFWFVRWLAWGRLTVRTVGDAPVAILVLLIPVTLGVTALPDITWQQVSWLLTGIALYYVIANWVQTGERERSFIRFVTGAVVLSALIAPFAVTWVTAIKLTFIPEAVYDRLPALAPVPIHPNVLAGAIVLALPLPLALLMFGAPEMKRGERVAAGAAVLGIAGILILTKSRGAMLAAGAAVLLLCLLRWRRAWMVMLLGAVLAGLVFWRIGYTHLVELLSDSGSIVGFPGRMEIWSRGIYLVQDFPFTGIGMGTYRQVTNALYPFFLLGPNADIPHSHNLFLQVAVDLGIPGLVAWLGLLFLAVFGGWRVYRFGRRAGRGWDAGLGAGLLAAQLALGVHGMLDAAVWGAHSGIVVWALWGIGTASYNLRYGPD